jgi:hypothetical protein
VQWLPSVRAGLPYVCRARPPAVQRRGADRVDLFCLGELDRTRDEAVRGVARNRRQLAERQISGNQIEVDAVDRARLVTRFGRFLGTADTSDLAPPHTGVAPTQDFLDKNFMNNSNTKTL